MPGVDDVDSKADQSAGIRHARPVTTRYARVSFRGDVKHWGSGDQGPGTRIQDETRYQSEHQKRPKKYSSKASVAKDEWKEQGAELGEETERELEEKVRGWMKAEKELGMYVVCEGRRLRWRELAGLEEGQTAEVLVELKGGSGQETGQEEQQSVEHSSVRERPGKVRSESKFDWRNRRADSRRVGEESGSGWRKEGYWTSR